MKLFNITPFCILLFFMSCQKEVENVDFDIKAELNTVKTGEAVTFKLGGNPDVISFYSGEIGNDYEYVDKDRILSTNQLNMSFQTQVRPQGGSQSFCQDGQLNVLVSNDLQFTGNTKADSIAGIKAATWTNINDKFTLCPLECLSTTNYALSGVSNIIDFFKPGKPLYIAFKYVNRPVSLRLGNATIWRFSSLQLNAATDVATTTILTQANGGWTPVYIGDGWGLASYPEYSNAASVVTMRGNISNQYEQELWCVSKAIYLTDTNLGHEFGVGIKTYADPDLLEYKYVYNKPGKYTATFVAVNADGTDRKQSVRQVEIEVVP